MKSTAADSLDPSVQRGDHCGHEYAVAMLSGALGRDENGEGKRCRGSQRRGKGEHCVQGTSTHEIDVLGGLQREAGGGGLHAHADASVASFWREVEEDHPAPSWAGLVGGKLGRGQWGLGWVLFPFFFCNLFMFSFFFCCLFCLK